MSDADDDDISDRRAPKRSRGENMSKLIDDIAEDDDDPDADDDDYDDDHPDDDADDDAADFIADNTDASALPLPSSPSSSRAPKGKARMPRGADIDEDDTLHLTLDQLRDQREADRLVADLESRYGGADGDEEGIDLNEEDYDDYDDAEGSSGAVLPSIKDPKLWLIRCDPGKEDVMCLALMKRYLDCVGKGDALHIHSAFTTPASKGYVYIEADKEVHVKRAIRGLRALKWWQLQLIPIAQMVNAVKFHDDVPVIHRGQWVRVKSGLYKGDLGQVYALSDQQSVITVKLIPRIDLSTLDDADAGRKRRRAFPPRGADRPPQALFNPSEVQKKGGVVSVIKSHPTDRRRYAIFGSSRYRQGYLYKDMRATGLYHESIQPTADEADRFLSRIRGGDSDDDDDDEQLLPPPPPSRAKGAPLFAIGDHVIVSEGAMKNITGRITSLSKTQTTIQPDVGQPIAMPVDLMPKEIKKFFRLGDHVKVVGGMYRDETGMITQVQQAADTLSVYSDTSLRELLVNTQDVIESSEVSSGRESLGSFSLYDLVQLSDAMVAVIVKVEVASFKVLTQRGVQLTVKLQELGAKRSSRFAAALDAAGNQITRDDVVHVNSGEYRGKQGTIKHIYRHFLFLYSRSIPDQAGMFVVTAKTVTLVGQTMQRKPIVPQSPQIGFGAEDSSGGGGGGGGGGGDIAGKMGPPAARRKVGERHPLVGKTVIITGGPYKSFMGIVMEATEINVQVELHAMARKVLVPIAEVREKSAVTSSTTSTARPGDAGRADFFMGGQTPLLGSRTPAYEVGNATPAHDAFAGSQTPAYGGSTPSRDAWSAQTPARAWDDEAGGEEEDVGEEWRHDYNTTPVPNTPSNVKTPNNARAEDEEEDGKEGGGGGQHGRRVPRTPLTPSTPASRVPLTPLPHDDYTTPHTPMQRREEKGAGDDDDTLPSHHPSASSSSSSSSSPSTLLPVGAKVLTPDGLATITRHTPDGGVRVRLDATKGEVAVGAGAVGGLKGVAPEKGDSVVVVSGELNVGQTGSLIGINQHSGEAIVNIDGDITILPVSTLCKYDRTTTTA